MKNENLDMQVCFYRENYNLITAKKHMTS